jgi:phosphate transport system permease protein
MTPLGAHRLRRARAIDRLVAAAITAGGSLILLAVALLMVFLLVECLPLLRGGNVSLLPAAAGPPAVLAAAEDEYRENVIVLAGDGAFHLIGRDGPTRSLPAGELTPPLRQAVTSADGRLFAATDSGTRAHVWAVRMRVRWEGQSRVLSPLVRHVLAVPGAPDTKLLAVSGDATAASLLLVQAGQAVLVRSGEDGPTAVVLAGSSSPVAGALASDGAQAWVATARRLLWYRIDTTGDAGPVAPAAEAPLPAAPTAMTMMLGDVTCMLGDGTGTVTAWQEVAGDVAGTRRLERSATFAGAGAVVAVAPSQRDKTFAILRSRSFEVAHLTSRRVLMTEAIGTGRLLSLGFSPRRDGLFGITDGGAVHRWAFSAPHPEVSAETLFLPVRYEGFTKPELVWQSTGGSSDFEAKMSLVPLLVGTFKGAVYALLFSAPCAVAAALYVSQFAPRRIRLVTKPVVELMAALPSVVVGFLAALFLAPLLERHLVGVLALVAALPVAVAGLGAGWGALPLRHRRKLGRGGELALIAAVLALTWVLVFATEDPLHRALFGGNFRQWLHDAAGVGFDQRNAVVVGFALGFAVIPIIFTLAEDAFSNVPPSLVSASLALGATPWQAARTVVLPAASPGLFAAVMTGLGRAVGETMIVLMATGNTPVLSLSPFDGMRTMSACIAVELPEAPHGGSLYRVLILTALMLFAMTFALNTVAVVISARLRARFGKLAA